MDKLDRLATACDRVEAMNADLLNSLLDRTSAKLSKHPVQEQEQQWLSGTMMDHGIHGCVNEYLARPINIAFFRRFFLTEILSHTNRQRKSGLHWRLTEGNSPCCGGATRFETSRLPTLAAACVTRGSHASAILLPPASCDRGRGRM